MDDISIQGKLRTLYFHKMKMNEGDFFCAAHMLTPTTLASKQLLCQIVEP